jgi:DNA-binding MarR family transcriptional regulator
MIDIFPFQFEGVTKAHMATHNDSSGKPIAKDHMVVAIDVASELQTMIIAEQVYRDYMDILKSSVMPEIIETFGLKIRDIRILANAAEQNGRISAADIAHNLRQDPATITRSMVSLIGLGFVTTSESFEDGRSRVINLTDKGFEAVGLYNDLTHKALTKATIIDETFMSSDNLRSTKTVMAKLAKRLSRLSRNLRSRSRNSR